MFFRSVSGRRGGRRSYLSNVDNLDVFDALPICFWAQRGSQLLSLKIDHLYVVDALPICFGAQRASEELSFRNR